jgi:hypothetical protein
MPSACRASAGGHRTGPRRPARQQHARPVPRAPPLCRCRSVSRRSGHHQRHARPPPGAPPPCRCRSVSRRSGHHRPHSDRPLRAHTPPPPGAPRRARVPPSRASAEVPSVPCVVPSAPLLGAGSPGRTCHPHLFPGARNAGSMNTMMRDGFTSPRFHHRGTSPIEHPWKEETGIAGIGNVIREGSPAKPARAWATSFDPLPDPATQKCQTRGQPHSPLISYFLLSPCRRALADLWFERPWITMRLQLTLSDTLSGPDAGGMWGLRRAVRAVPRRGLVGAPRRTLASDTDSKVILIESDKVSHSGSFTLFQSQAQSLLLGTYGRTMRPTSKGTRRSSTSQRRGAHRWVRHTVTNIIMQENQSLTDPLYPADSAEPSSPCTPR